MWLAGDRAQRNRRSKAVPVLGAAGLSLSLATGASAAIDGMSARLLTPVSQQKTLREEEISDVSLATFHVFDNEQVGSHLPNVRVAFGCACGGCAGCGGCGCACGIGLYYHYTPPVVGEPVHSPSRPQPNRPAHKYKSHRGTR